MLLERRLLDVLGWTTSCIVSIPRTVRTTISRFASAHLWQNGLLCDALDEQRIVRTILARDLDSFTSAVQLFG